MNTEEYHKLETRLNRLEREIAELRRILTGDPVKPASPAAVSPPRPAPAELVFKDIPAAPEETPPWRTVEFWLGRIGIGLTLLAVVFLFDYAVDRGWLTPWTRIGLGLATGFAMAVFGLRIRATHAHLSSLLQGGALAAFYICGFAAFRMYELVGYPAALAWMCVVTAAGLLRSYRAREVTLSLVAAFGGLATPSLLYTGTGSAAGLMLYLAVLLAGCLGIFWMRGWRVFYWVVTAGGWIVIYMGVDLVEVRSLHNSDFLSVLLAMLLLGWLGMWLVLLLRELAENRGKLSKPSLDGIPEWCRDAAGWLQTVSARAAVPLLSAAVLAALFDLLRPSTLQLTWLWFALAGVYAAAYALLRRTDGSLLSGGHGVVAVTALTGGVTCYFSGNALLVALAAEALLVHLAASRLEDRAISIPAHLVAALSLGALVNSLAAGYPAGGEILPAFNAGGIAQLAELAMLVLVSYLIADTESLPQVYRLTAHIGLLAWLARELGRLPDGDGWVSASWGLYALLLTVPGLLRGNHALRIAGLSTLFLTVGKLLLVDLARVDPLWRILLFLAFGAVFLVLGYRLRNLWSDEQTKNKQIGTPGESECISQ